jgi:hypothetical protein
VRRSIVNLDGEFLAHFYPSRQRIIHTNGSCQLAARQKTPNPPLGYGFGHFFCLTLIFVLEARMNTINFLYNTQSLFFSGQFCRLNTPGVMTRLNLSQNAMIGLKGNS